MHRELVPEALYAKDITVTSGTTVDAQGLGSYYTGTLTNNGTISNGTAFQLTATLYGDFDGDQASLYDPDDVTRFNAAFPSELGDENYDHLVDWNCDGFIDCLDRAQYIANYGAYGIEDNDC